jgi:hypothetical protein
MFDCADPRALARFWAQVKPDGGALVVMPGGAGRSAVRAIAPG